jgi:HD-GYP domain-containing protein (c-di-GMP phosphodiesterase class II)
MSRIKERKQYESPEILNLEYYQISTEIFSKFPRHRPPLTLYRFKEATCSLVPVAHPGQFLSKERQQEIETCCSEGNLFVSREDHHLYAQHISEQLDLVLLDKNLETPEIADIFRCSLTKRYTQLLDQPDSLVFERLQTDLLVLTEYLWQDLTRIRTFTRHLFTGDKLAHHEFNVAVAGIGLYLAATNGQPKRSGLDRLALGLFTHDLGMSRIPAFILNKSGPLSRDEHVKVTSHPAVGAAILRKLGVAHNEIFQCVLEHHERIDGSGYPLKSSGNDISLPGRICAVADSFSAMISERPYSVPMPPNEACASLGRDMRYDKRMTTLLNALITGQ